MVDANESVKKTYVGVIGALPCNLLNSVYAFLVLPGGEACGEVRKENGDSPIDSELNPDDVQSVLFQACLTCRQLPFTLAGFYNVSVESIPQSLISPT